MNNSIVLISFVAYTLLIFFISWFTTRKADSESYYTGNKASPWYVVSYGMIGASLSGVTFMSVPGWVGSTQFSYMAVVFGYFIGYLVIALILLPLYYRLNLTSIYGYLGQRFGVSSYRTGSAFFILSRMIGAAFRMFLVINVLHIFVFDALNIPFWLMILIFTGIILLYTFKGGIKTIVWTDTMQTTFMLAAVVISIFIILNSLDISLPDLIGLAKERGYTKIFEWDWQSKQYFWKQFASGVFIAIVMTGLDQDMMQKNLTCKSLRDAKKNMLTLSGVMMFINLLFLFLGAALYIFANETGISTPTTTDNLFPMLAMQKMGSVAAIVFVIGLISAAYSSADGSLTALTTAFCIDILDIRNRQNWNEKMKKRVRTFIHLLMAVVMMVVIMIFHEVNDEAVISAIFTAAGYTYGPLLGLFAFGLYTRFSVHDRLVPIVAVVSPIVCYLLSYFSIELFNGYVFGFELLILNGLLTFAGLLALIRKKEAINC
ncbi:MAG: sodium:solute symporter [Bacteroidetes bacterium]|nr:sodium:solute symporter [Bacteroidota bacterium]MBU1720861.1 sodium:solute symporter [Bacteroidota bacterium]